MRGVVLLLDGLEESVVGAVLVEAEVPWPLPSSLAGFVVL